ncbi:unnamed protein product [Parajaminaea phylloscopi]
MTSSSLQFGPEWMRKAPAKPAAPAASPSSNPPAAPGHGAAAQQHSHTHPTHAPQQSAKRNPSLGLMGGPAPVLSPAPAPSPGGFSFAAAAAGGVDRAPTAPHSLSSVSASPLAASHHPAPHNHATPLSNGHSALAGGTHANEKDPALRYAKDQSLSLYSSKETLSPSTENPSPAAHQAGADASLASHARKKIASERDPLLRRNTSVDHSSSSSSHHQAAEPRGLNARGSAASSTERSERDRPGLFQRVSSGSFSRNESMTYAAAGTPAVTQPSAASRERFSGIQGGVLSGVAPPERRRKESEGLRSARATSGSEDANALRGGSAGLPSDASTLAAKQAKVKPSLEGIGVTGPAASPETTGAKVVSPGLGPASAPANSSWSNRRRERGPADGPIGPPAEGAAGFGRFAGYDRKRERTGGSNADTWRSSSSSGRAHHTSSGQHGETAGEHPPEDLGAPVAQDPAAVQSPAETARQELDSLTLGQHHDSERAVLAKQGQIQQDWSAETQQWLYRDPTGQVQGPFAASLMQSWYEGNYFTDDLMVRPEEQEEFRPLADFVAQSGTNPKLFLSPPPSFARPQEAQSQPASLPGATHVEERDLRSSSFAPTSVVDGMPSEYRRDQSRDPFQSSFDQPLSAGARWDAPQADAQSGWIGNHFATGGYPTAAASPFSGPFTGLAQSPFLAQGSLQGPGDQYSLDARLRHQEQYLGMLQSRDFQSPEADGRGNGPSLSFGQLPAIDRFGGADWAKPSPQREVWAHDVQSQHHEPGISAASDAPQTPWRNDAELRDGQSQLPQTPWREAIAQQDYVGVIGTPVRSRSPAQPLPTESEVTPDQPAGAAETLNDIASREHIAALPSEPTTASTTLTTPQGSQEPQLQGRPVTPQPVDPAPEQDWPQSPSAVEFASQPDFEHKGLLRDEIDKKSSRAGPANRNAQTKQAHTPGPASKSSVPSAAGGNVKVVQAHQFRANADSNSESTSVQVPLASLVSGGQSATGVASPATPGGSKIAPWAQSAASEETHGAAGTMTLREIQDLEARQAEARRNAEKLAAQRRAAAGAGLRTPATANENLPTTMTWGLASIPSSVSKTHSAGGASDSGGSPVISSQPAAWTAAAAGGKPKKTLMEIQEEERKRALTAQRKAAAALSAAGKSSAEQGPRPSAATQAAAAGPGWSIVGAGGKPSVATSVPSSTPTPVAAPGARPVPVGLPQRTASSAAIPGVPGGQPWASANGTAQPRVAPAQANVPSTAAVGRTRSAGVGGVTSQQVLPSGSPSVVAAARDPDVPSPEFVRYCKEQFQGLSGVKMDDFIEMLLSFPLDATPDVIDIIAESIYAHSSTLDGRRLANDFVAKRKLDAGVPDKSGRGAGATSGAKAAGTGLANGIGGASRSNPAGVRPTSMAATASGTQPSGGMSGVSGANNSAGAGGGGGFQQVVKKGAKKRNNH